MSKIKASLEENKAHILEALPEEFHSGFEKELSDLPETATTLSGDAEIAAIKAELVANPSVNESDAAGELKTIENKKDTTEPLSGDAEIAAIKAELVANPSVDESAAAAELKEI